MREAVRESFTGREGRTRVWAVLLMICAMLAAIGYSAKAGNAEGEPPPEPVPLEEEAPENPLGVHGVGEASTALVAPAVANAIARASGLRLRTLPFTLERVRAALEKEEA